MNERVQAFIAFFNNQFIEVSDRTNIYQCMDLVYCWIACLGIPKDPLRRLYAYQVFTSADDTTRKYFDVIPNTPEGVPQAGDVVVWKYGVAGHIAIATGKGDVKTFEVFEQNNPMGSYPKLAYHDYTNVLGWLRPKEIGYIGFSKGNIIKEIYKALCNREASADEVAWRESQPLSIADTIRDILKDGTTNQLGDVWNTWFSGVVEDAKREAEIAHQTDKEELVIDWQTTLNTANEKIRILETQAVNQYDWRTLMSIAWKKFWVAKKAGN